ncbi:hypothetical protein HY570_00815 [Candidatus Micrarchaeota archaeon]|nr:hypothetical protein [Candidatus Micrarchaeota archaeon]
MGLLNTLARITSYVALTLIVMLLVSVIPVSIILFNTNSILLNPTTYEQKFTKFQVYEKIKNSIITSLVEMLAGEGATIQIPISKEEAKNELSNAIPISWVKGQINNLIRNLFSYLNGEIDEPNLTINFQEIKPALLNAFKKIASKSIEEEYTGAIPNEILDKLQCSGLLECLEKCKLPQYESTCEQLGLNSSIATQGIEGQISDQLPDKINLWEEAKKSDQVQYAAQVREYIKILKLVPLALILTGVISVILIIVISHNIKSTPRWLGTGLFFGGLTTVLAGYALPNILQSSIMSSSPQGLAENELMSTVLEILFDIIKDIGNNILVHGAIPLILGLILWAVSIALVFLDKPKIKVNPKESGDKTSYIR